jgi:hypothetical protein
LGTRSLSIFGVRRLVAAFFVDTASKNERLLGVKRIEIQSDDKSSHSKAGKLEAYPTF